MSSLQTAILIANNAHMNQKDKGGKPYILHPLTVMMGMDTKEEMIVAVLHDVIEDTYITNNDLEQYGFSAPIRFSISVLTKNPNDTYEHYIEYVKSDEIARKVKIKDIEHNLEILRLKTIKPKDLENIKKYHWAWNYLKLKE